jgi:PhzF family phenazine biosynthesis protein
MALPIYQVDAFASEVFRGNPAAVMPLETWPADELLQDIAAENNLSETAFFVKEGSAYRLRWFTPVLEVDLCGHATLAAAHVLFAHIGVSSSEIQFETRSGQLRVHRAESGLTMDFPAAEIAPTDVDLSICNALGAIASEALLAQGSPGKLLYVYEFESDVANLQPDFGALKASTMQCIIATAPGDSCDAVSRFFGPQVGIDEDPVTGSAHCALVPYWSTRLHTSKLKCRQISARGGDLDCVLEDGRVFMTGTAVTYMQGFVEGV